MSLLFPIYWTRRQLCPTQVLHSNLGARCVYTSMNNRGQPNLKCYLKMVKKYWSPAFPGPKSRPRVQQFQNAIRMDHSSPHKSSIPVSVPDMFTPAWKGETSRGWDTVETEYFGVSVNRGGRRGGGGHPVKILNWAKGTWGFWLGDLPYLPCLQIPYFVCAKT